ncbi:hypothetical protein BACOVA_01466 [Bacteroides ovatus ATCC 8483]|uniref:Uncharacterized protein n=1 Tax=Bacteroides ovatus (strain ATCC 8483 / DSM 1896 / JCM 5824 / BCRC 10623 / CCUG 4943 / NCTC 11153) TaxID=411476 RepID=A0AAN3AAX4_BACO1|nr:hypothetical protein BACOVA_01466 [Bacteroides ovatus ATCC 8483]
MHKNETFVQKRNILFNIYLSLPPEMVQNPYPTDDD